MTKEEREHELMRRELWVKVAVGVASCEETKNIESPTEWADEALRAFDEKFKAIEPLEHPDSNG